MVPGSVQTEEVHRHRQRRYRQAFQTPVRAVQRQNQFRVQFQHLRRTQRNRQSPFSRQKRLVVFPQKVLQANFIPAPFFQGRVIDREEDGELSLFQIRLWLRFPGGNAPTVSVNLISRFRNRADIRKINALTVNLPLVRIIQHRQTHGNHRYLSVRHCVQHLKAQAVGVYHGSLQLSAHVQKLFGVRRAAVDLRPGAGVEHLLKPPAPPQGNSGRRARQQHNRRDNRQIPDRALPPFSGAARLNIAPGVRQHPVHLAAVPDRGLRIFRSFLPIQPKGFFQRCLQHRVKYRPVHPSTPPFAAVSIRASVPGKCGF